ncbi:protein cereblon-like [Actinia tenebrosa]|uniref:Protein cereblon-like n=1 Tax=Actinia tenebrosa TaxID=6105 RepID=A0A6P8IHY8_ACTTE|nr:protein cereblon-like [Actinia tenebrosa]
MRHLYELSTLWAVLGNIFFVSVIRSADVDVPIISDTLLCRQCGHEVTSSEHLYNIGSKLALAQRNDTIIGNRQCLIQMFKNPNGHHFELITTKKASIQPLGNAFLEHSWFPEFAWRVAVCPQCGSHLGWSFEDPNHKHKDEKSKQANGQKKTKTPYSFVGLIFPNLIKENYADSLIVTPRAYRG